MSDLAELIEPGSILDMSQDDLESLILSIRERRNRVIKARSSAHHRARASGVLSLRPKLEKLALRLDRAILKLDAQLARCEGMVREVVAMRLELGDATPSELAAELRVDDGSPDHESDNVQGSSSDHGGDNVQGSQERPHSGINPIEASISHNPYWTGEDETDT